MLGLTVILAAYFLQKGKVITNRVFLSFLVLCGIGCIGVGAFPMDSPVPYAHLMAALLAFLFGALAAIASFKFQRAPASYFSVVLAYYRCLSLSSSPRGST